MTHLNLNECLVCELKVKTIKCFITILYRSPSQSIENFDEVNKRSQQAINMPYATLLIEEFCSALLRKFIFVIK